MDKQRIVVEIHRVAKGAESLTQTEFEERAGFSLNTVRYTFGSSNQAVVAAGLKPNPATGSAGQHRRTVTDEEYLHEILRLSEILGRPVPEAEMNSKGRFSTTIARKRWGSFSKAREAAFAMSELNSLKQNLNIVMTSKNSG